MNKEFIRRTGRYFTPKIWVDEAHKMISKTFDLDWKEKYVVWDCACGLCNLTKDYKFKELYCSTLHQSDIDIINKNNFNPEAVKFQFDFLNDDLKDLKIKAPELFKALKEGKEILFLINPPYGTSGSGKANGISKTNISKTNISKEMKDDGWGAPSQQLYAQFLYRITQLQKENKKIKLGLFSPPLFLSGSSYKKFRKKFFNYFSFKSGFLINANNFADVKDWGLSFSIFDKFYKYTSKYLFIKKELDDNLNIINNKKYIYNLDDNISFSEWIKRKVKKEKTFDVPQMSSALKINNKNGLGKLIKNSYGYIHIDGNNLNGSIKGVYLLTSASYHGHGISILNKNILDVCIYFLTRKNQIIKWFNMKDEYIAPTEEVQKTNKYKQYNNDAIVYSLFNTSSNQSSLRQIKYKEKLWNIKNEFFWLSKKEMMNLSIKYNFEELYNDAKNSNERFVYKLLNGKLNESDFKEVGLTYIDKNNKPILSPDAQELLDLSKELIKKSFKYRKTLHKKHPEYHINTWDAGWYQIKKILKEHFKDDYKIFVEKYKKFEDRLRPQVYELGFLLK